MAATKFMFPKQWEDWCSWGLGIWLCISPWALHFDLELSATHAAVITGLLVIFTELVTLSVYRSWEEWFNVLLGIWLLAAPWILEIMIPAVTANFIVVGLLVLMLAIYEIWHGGPEVGNQA